MARSRSKPPQERPAPKSLEPDEIAEAQDYGISEDGRVILSTGVVIQCKAAPSLIVTRAIQAIPKPEVPIVPIPDQGRDEPNPDDPEYKAALLEYFDRQALVGNDVMLMFGTEPVTIPEGVEKPDDEGWIEALTVLGIPTPETEKGRYLEWLKTVAAPSEGDLLKLTIHIGSFTGLREEEVAAAAERFRDQASRRTDPEPSAEE